MELAFHPKVIFHCPGENLNWQLGEALKQHRDSCSGPSLAAPVLTGD